MALSYPALFVLQALSRGFTYGFEVMDVTGLPSGTIYPVLRRLERAGLVSSTWEPDVDARKASRPRRRHYSLTRAGRAQLVDAEAKYRAVAGLFPKRSRA
jgi:PadR family transcriptional regulator, regulatory protein PadR